ncbi:MAG: type II toxin-antitoxin system prevent-host-death family antitoxin [Wenzhouxiangellaceae bacterium]
MKQVNIYEAKTQLSKLVEAAAAGEEVIIARAGKPAARLVALQRPTADKRPIGLLDGQLRIPEDFNAALPDDLLAAFYHQG